jgi:Alginate export
MESTDARDLHHPALARPLYRPSTPWVIVAMCASRSSISVDAVYDKVGAVLLQGAGTTARYVGAETDFLMTYNVTRHLQQYGGYGFFSAGDFFEKTAPNKDSHFMYAAVQYTF